MDADGTNERRLDTVGAPSFGPTWSPDGSKLAFLTFVSNEATAMFRGFMQDALAVLDVHVLDVATGQIRDVGSKVVTDLNRAQWFSEDSLLFARIKQ